MLFFIVVFYIFIIWTIIYAIYCLVQIKNYTFETQKYLIEILEYIKQNKQ